jgi:adenylosuccinate lyase
VPEPYEKLKAFTRGQRVTQQSMQEFVAALGDLPSGAREELKQLTPWTYLGNAAQQAKGLAPHL